ncbi:MAG: hypothetical protein ACPG7F_16065 [Aggregatilineales bacterium]
MVDRTPMESPPESDELRLLSMIWQWLLQHIWYVHDGAVLTVAAAPRQCMHILEKASRPRVNRLDFSNLYMHGQRYSLHMLDDLHFMMTVTRSVAWRYRSRTSSSTVLYGRFVKSDTQDVHLHLTGRIRLFYILQFLLLPLFITSIIIFMPWHPIWIASFVIALFILSWVGHRYHAALEAHDMVFFIQRVLDEHRPMPAPILAEGAHIDYEDASFGEAWEKFYRTHRDDA